MNSCSDWKYENYMHKNKIERTFSSTHGVLLCVMLVSPILYMPTDEGGWDRKALPSIMVGKKKPLLDDDSH